MQIADSLYRYAYNLTEDGSFGIKCTDSSNHTVCAVNNFTENQSAAEDIVNLLNKYNVSPIHFEDIIEDELL